MTRPLYKYQAATALYLGRRDNQEDAVAADFTTGAEAGFAVLSDGMGGHNAGDIASKIVVTEVYSELKLHSGNALALRSNIREILYNAAMTANACVGEVANDAPDAFGMGATVIVPVFLEDQLFWISVGDSPLYLFREGSLRQLNEDHSMAPHIDMLVSAGMLSESSGRDHPDRNCLTSVLAGDEVARVDCPDAPTQLFEGDVVIAASDGLQTLDQSELKEILSRVAHAPSEEIAEALIEEIENLDRPDQDNVCLAVVKLCKPAKRTKALGGFKLHKRAGLVGQRSAAAGFMPRLSGSLARFLPATHSPAE